LYKRIEQIIMCEILLYDGQVSQTVQQSSA
jgi:hypothetical protein